MISTPLSTWSVENLVLLVLWRNSDPALLKGSLGNTIIFLHVITSDISARSRNAQHDTYKAIMEMHFTDAKGPSLKSSSDDKR